MREIGVYIHIPFCKRKCEYCDFISMNQNQEVQDRYVKALLKTIEHQDFDDLVVKTIYIGGGTPSYILENHIEEIILKIKDKAILDENVEITIEVNPGTVNKNKLEVYKRIGINRVSIGCQTVQDRLLKLIGRIHTYEEFENTYNLIRDVGFENVNVDLMIGLPTQTIEDVEESVKKIMKLKPEHISMYSLILEEGTPLCNKVDNGELKMIDEKLERKMYKKMVKLLASKGYNHYEISNFARKGYESKHNLDCWNQKEYLGFGLASHSYFDKKRYSNIINLENYMKNIEKNDYEKNIEIHEEQDEEMMKKEFMMLGLRKIDGVSISEFEQKFNMNPLFYFRFEISELEEEDLIEIDLDRIKLTSKGLDFANIVWEKFV